MINKKLTELGISLDGELKSDYSSRLMYATDASAYRQVPAGVVFPKHIDDIKQIVNFCYHNDITLITRGGGTSLAGQVVGNGLIMDLSRYMTRIVELNVDERWVVVEPGVILDELNRYLKPHSLFFGPETSTSSRCTIGGMVGNNSCGSHSIVYKTVREHLLEAHVVLSDGSTAIFKPVDKQDIINIKLQQNIEGEIYRTIDDILSIEANRTLIADQFPDPTLYRRNNGYAIDILAQSNCYNSSNERFNLCKLLSGSEGTLAIGTLFKLNLVDLPPRYLSLVCAHFDSLTEALEGNLIALKHNPSAVELIDYNIIKAAQTNVEQQRNSFFIKGTPQAVLIVELSASSTNDIDIAIGNLISNFRSLSSGYHYSVITGDDVSKVWAFRKAGLGVLSNIEGDGKAVTVIEDTAVRVDLLPEYISELKEILKLHKLECVFHAHVGSGELHLRPVLDLKKSADRGRFRAVATDVAHLVKKYRGSLSGEHGDGRLRSEFIKIMVGNECYSFLEQIKQAFDPKGILNRGKIVNPVKMDTNLRYDSNITIGDKKVYFDFSEHGGLLKAIEKCNGSADCRRVNYISGYMCPTYIATLNESESTRARANLLREFLTNSSKQNRLKHNNLFLALDLCLSCKACKTECPANIDMAKFKAEFLQHYNSKFGLSLRSRLFANISLINKILSIAPRVSNYLLHNRFSKLISKWLAGISTKRSLPRYSATTLRKYIKTHLTPNYQKRAVYLFIDEFTNYTDLNVGIAAVKLLTKLGYNVLTIRHKPSGRAFISKGLLSKAAKLAHHHVSTFGAVVSDTTPLLGIEPSAILSFRDEYPALLRGTMQEKARVLARNCFLIEEFIVSEYKKGNISQDLFTNSYKTIKVHTHCHQKALASTSVTEEFLSLPVNYSVEHIKSGCCGMAGSFGYEKEHYNLSMQIGELRLFPEVRKSSTDTYIAANGTSCRQQIFDGTGRIAMHPVEILYNALKI